MKILRKYGNFIKFSGNRGKFVNFVEIGGKCVLKGMDAPAILEHLFITISDTAIQRLCCPAPGNENRLLMKGSLRLSILARRRGAVDLKVHVGCSRFHCHSLDHHRSSSLLWQLSLKHRLHHRIPSSCSPLSHFFTYSPVGCLFIAFRSVLFGIFRSLEWSTYTARRETRFQQQSSKHQT